MKTIHLVIIFIASEELRSGQKLLEFKDHPALALALSSHINTIFDFEMPRKF